MSTRERARVTGVVRQASNDCAANKFGRWLPDCNHSADDFIAEQRKNSPQIDANAQHDPWLGGALIRRRTLRGKGAVHGIDHAPELHDGAIAD
jgi:hypothetical protein